MVAGTSTGGIIALALGSGMTGKEALDIYLDRGERIFPPVRRLGKAARFLRWLTRPMHDQGALRDELLKVFGDKLVDESKVRLVIPCFEGRHGEPVLYKTPHHPAYQKDRHKKNCLL
jgi:patatin-like phospholipase/acyl hydrolase